MSTWPDGIVTPWDIINREYAARGWGQPFTAGLSMDGVLRAQWGTITVDDCTAMAKQFGTSVEMWADLNKQAANQLAAHGYKLVRDMG